MRGNVSEPDEGSAEAGKKARSVGHGLRVAVMIDVMKDEERVSEIKLPDLKPLQVCTFGRSEDASVTLQHPSLSRIHAQLEVGLRGELQLVDRGSGVHLLGLCACLWRRAGVELCDEELTL